MLDRQHRGRITFECDACDDTLDTDTADFTEARDCFQAERWFSKRNPSDTDWEHYCPICAPAARSSRGDFHPV